MPHNACFRHLWLCLLPQKGDAPQENKPHTGRKKRVIEQKSNSLVSSSFCITKKLFLEKLLFSIMKTFDFRGKFNAGFNTPFYNSLFGIMFSKHSFREQDKERAKLPSLRQFNPSPRVSPRGNPTLREREKGSRNRLPKHYFRFSALQVA